MPVDPFMLQIAWGVLLLALIAFQLAVGLRWIDLGRKRIKVHRQTGIALALLALPHAYFGFALAYGLPPL